LPWFADFANFKAAGIISYDLTFQQRKKFLHDVKSYFWDDPLLFRRCGDISLGNVFLRMSLRVSFGIVMDLIMGGI